MPTATSRPARARSTPRLLFASAGLSALFWLAVLSGKLHLQSDIEALPVFPGPALLLLLVVTLVLFLVACLIEEARAQAQPQSENTKGDM